MIKITFLLPVVSQMRFRKRIIALKDLGIHVKVLAFVRDYYSGKPIPGGYTTLGYIEHGHYISRLGAIIRAVPKVRAVLKEADAVYAFGFDMALLAWLASRGMNAPPKIVYEMGDIREIMLEEGLIGRVMRAVERFILRRCRLLVVTSEAFIKDYYQGVQGMADVPYMVVENKLDTNQLEADQEFPPEQKRFGSPLRIGYFGLIRCSRSWEVLKQVVRLAQGRVQVYIRGINMGVDNFEEEAKAISGIEYGGPYVAPDDLPGIYSQVDMIWVIAQYHQGKTGNLTWARANRFYESCFFRKPMFAQAGTEDGRMAEALGLGLSLDLSNVDRAVEDILSISNVDLVKWQDNMARIPKSVYTYTDEHEEIIERIR